jgi:serine/threonine protein kinase
LYSLVTGASLNDYAVGRELGKGAYAVVKICTNKITGTKFAMKIYDKSKLGEGARRKAVDREIQILR